MPASRVTSRRLSALKLRSSRSFSAAATIARRVASLRSSRDSFTREDEEAERPDRELGVRLFTIVKPTTTWRFPLTSSVFCKQSIHMFTQMLANRVLGSGLVDLLTGPHGVARYTDLVAPT